MAEYRVDELALAGDTSVRNVRVYQDRGLLPPPHRVGRTGVYSDAHLSRLRLIRLLLHRGHTFATIRELLDAHEAGQSIDHLLSIDGALQGPWTDERPSRISAAELVARLGSVSEEDLARARGLGVLRPDGDGFEVSSARLIEAGGHLVAAGMPLSTVLDLAETLRDEMGRVAALVFRVFDDHVRQTAPAPDAVADALLRLRPLAQQAIDALLATALAEESEKLLARRGEARARRAEQPE